MTLPEFSIKRRVTTAMIVLILGVLGLISLSRLNFDLFPDIEFPVVSTLVTYPGVGPEEIEESVTKVIETSVSMVSGVKSIESFTQEGFTAVMVQFDWGTNLDYAAQDIRDMIAQAEPYLPDEASKPMVVKFDISMMPIMVYGVVGGKDTQRLKKLLEDIVIEKIQKVDGVSGCYIAGGKTREIQVLVDKEKLTAYNLSIDQILGMLRAENINISGGHLIKGHKEYLVKTMGEYEEPEELENTIVSYTASGIPIYLKDIADVKDTHKEIRSYERIAGRDGIIMWVGKSPGANPLQVANRVTKALNELKDRLPVEVEFHELFSQGDMVKKVFTRTTGNIIWGGILAILAIFLFLRSTRPTLTIALAIPFSIIVTFIAIHAAGYTLNLMTMAGLALGVGMVVDTAIVVIENIFRHIEEGETKSEAARKGANEVMLPLIAATITTVVVFLPLAFAGGISAMFTRGLALTVAFALLASLFCAFTVVPMLAALTFKKGQFKTEWFEKVKEWYKGRLSWALQHRKVTLFSVLGIFILSIVLTFVVGTEFVPAMDQSMIDVMIRMPPGTSLQETDRVISQIESIANQIDDIAEVGVMIGISAGREYDVAYGAGPTGVHEGEVFVTLKERKDRKLTSPEIIKLMSDKLPTYHNVEVEFLDMNAMMFGGGVKPVNINIFGADLKELKSIGNEAKSAVEDVAGLVDLRFSLEAGRPEFQIKVDKERAALLGVTVYEIGNAVSVALRGVTATKLRQKGEEIDIVVKFKEEDVQRVSDIENIPIMSRTGKKVLLKQVAEIEVGEGPIRIEREDKMRKASITASVRGRDLGSCMRDVIERLKTLRLPTGYFLDFGGEYEEMREMFKTLGFVFGLAILLVYMVMAASFESITHPFVIMFTIPLAWIGVVLGLLIAGRNISLLSGVGIIMLVGIVVNNGIVMIDYINRLRRSGMEKTEAIINGAGVRLRPVLITAITTIAGMLPMALSRSEGAEMRAPMAITVIGGLIASTVLTLIFLPVLYYVLDKFAQRKTLRKKTTLK